MEKSEIVIPIICENDLCKNYGKAINMIRGIPARELDLFYESYDGSEEEDYCLFCGKLGVAEDPLIVTR